MTDLHSAMPTRAVLACIAFWLACALSATFLHGPVPLFSTRTLSVAWEMWQHGHWVVPHINGEPYSHKTPLLYWLIHAGWLLLGVGDAWPRILVVLIGATNLYLIHRLAWRLFRDRDIANVAPWVFAAMHFPFLFGLQIMFEPLLVMGVLTALIGIVPNSQLQLRPNGRLLALGLAIALYSKGPVALLHVAIPIVFARFWLPEADRHWYARSLLAIGLASLAFLTWVIAAAYLGGAAYREELLWSQTAGRVVASFDHARPFWWYLPILFVIAFPWLAWPNTWLALWRSTWRERGFRFLAVWLLGSLLAFSIISGKQAYYLLPQLAGFAILLTAALWRAQFKLRAWPLGALFVLLGLLVASLPWLVEKQIVDSFWLRLLAQAGGWYGLAMIAAGSFLFLKAESDAQGIRRIAIASLIVVGLLHLQFTRTAWPRYDLQPAADVLALAEKDRLPIANVGTYEGQYQFLARLQKPIVELNSREAAIAWAQAHPDGVIIDYIDRDDASTNRKQPTKAIWRQGFRSDELALWRADQWLAQQTRN